MAQAAHMQNREIFDLKFNQEKNIHTAGKTKKIMNNSGNGKIPTLDENHHRSFNAFLMYL